MEENNSEKLGDTGQERPQTKVPNSIAAVFAAQSESGESQRAIARMWGVAPSTVKAAIDRIPVDQLRSIRQAVAINEIHRNQEVFDKIHGAIMNRDFNAVDDKGRYINSTMQLVTMKAILADKTQILTPMAGMADPNEKSGAINPLVSLLQNNDEINDAVQTLPEGVRAKLDVSMELSRESRQSEPSLDAVDASFEEDAKE